MRERGGLGVKKGVGGYMGADVSSKVFWGLGLFGFRVWGLGCSFHHHSRVSGGVAGAKANTSKLIAC